VKKVAPLAANALDRFLVVMLKLASSLSSPIMGIIMRVCCRISATISSVLRRGGGALDGTGNDLSLSSRSGHHFSKVALSVLSGRPSVC